MASAGLGRRPDFDPADCCRRDRSAHRYQSRHDEGRGLTQMGAAIEVRNLKAYYGNSEALHDVSMDVGANQVTALIGPSGCGKSTFVRTLNRMHETIPGAHVDGSVVIGGVDIY